MIVGRNYYKSKYSRNTSVTDTCKIDGPVATQSEPTPFVEVRSVTSIVLDTDRPAPRRMSRIRTSKWFLVTRHKPSAKYRLFCFPYAGGSATAFMEWEDLLPDDVELVAIQPPGRADRMNEGLLTSVGEMAQQIVRAIPPLLDRSYLIYGHSLGSVVSFELLHALKIRNLPLPQRFFCGARRAPHTASRIPPIHDYPLEEFKSELKGLNGTPSVVLDNADLMEIFVPILRTDFKAAYMYRREPVEKLECEVSVFCGSRDDKVIPEDMLGWQDHFMRQADFRIFDGGHFFMNDNKASVVNAILESIARRHAEPNSSPVPADRECSGTACREDLRDAGV